MSFNNHPEYCFKHPEDVEEEAKIKRIDFYRRSFLKIAFYYLFSIITLGMVALLAKWKINFRVLFKYYKSTLHDAEYLIITGQGSFIVNLYLALIRFYIRACESSKKVFAYSRVS